jgi:hypothetical protein
MMDEEHDLSEEELELLDTIQEYGNITIGLDDIKEVRIAKSLHYKNEIGLSYINKQFIAFKL